MSSKLKERIIVCICIVSAFTYLVVSGVLWDWCKSFANVAGGTTESWFLLVGGAGYVVTMIAWIITAIPLIKYLFPKHK